MFVTFWIIVVLLGILLSRNARYAVRQYLANRNLLLFTIYMVFLVGLGYLVVHLTTRVITILQAAREIPEVSESTPYVARRLQGY